MDGSINSAAAEESGVCGIDYGIELEGRDVAFEEDDAGVELRGGGEGGFGESAGGVEGGEGGGGGEGGEVFDVGHG